MHPRQEALTTWEEEQVLEEQGELMENEHGLMNLANESTIMCHGFRGGLNQLHCSANAELKGADTPPYTPLLQSSHISSFHFLLSCMPALHPIWLSSNSMYQSAG
jgi:hypothetical protein